MRVGMMVVMVVVFVLVILTVVMMVSVMAMARGGGTRQCKSHHRSDTLPRSNRALMHP